MRLFIEQICEYVTYEVKKIVSTYLIDTQAIINLKTAIWDLQNDEIN